jgi:hypothetical protein
MINEMNYAEVEAVNGGSRVMKVVKAVAAAVGATAVVAAADFIEGFADGVADVWSDGK